MILPHLLDLQKTGLHGFSWCVRNSKIPFPHVRRWCLIYLYIYIYINLDALEIWGDVCIQFYNRLWASESTPFCWNGRISKYLKSHQECCYRTMGFYRNYEMHHKVSLQIIYNWKVNACDCRFHTIYYNQLAKLKFTWHQSIRSSRKKNDVFRNTFAS